MGRMGEDRVLVPGSTLNMFLLFVGVVDRMGEERALAPGSTSNIFLLFVGVMGSMGEDRGCLALGKLLCTVLGAGAGAERRRAKPVGPAGEVSCAGG